MTTSLSWLTQIPASTTQEYAAGPEGAETLHLVFALITGTGDHYRRTPTGDAVAELVEEVARLRAELEEARLTLAAEQGRAEGAPFSSSPRLRAAVNAERIRQGLSWRGLAARIGVSSSGFTRWNAGHELSVPAYLKVCDWLRSAMLAADAATEAR